MLGIHVLKHQNQPPKKLAVHGDKVGRVWQMAVKQP